MPGVYFLIHLSGMVDQMPRATGYTTAGDIFIFLGCDIKRLKNALHQKLNVEQSVEFQQFCVTVGAPTLFNTLLSAVTSERQSERRINLNKKRIVSVIYTLFFCLSQQCNNLHVDHGLYLHSSRTNQEGIDTQHQLGNTCTRRTVNNVLDSLATNHNQQLKNFVTTAMENEWLLVLIIDDYTNIHTFRRPTGNNPSRANNMCTIVTKAFRNIKAVEIPQDINKLHDPQGLNVLRCQQVISSSTQMSKLAATYASTMSNWITREFLQPESERSRISVHEYCESASVRTMRRMDDLQLVDFF